MICKSISKQLYFKMSQSLFVCILLYGFKYCYSTQIILFNINNFFTQWFQVLLSNTT